MLWSTALMHIRRQKGPSNNIKYANMAYFQALNVFLMAFSQSEAFLFIYFLTIPNKSCVIPELFCRIWWRRQKWCGRCSPCPVGLCRVWGSCATCSSLDRLIPADKQKTRSDSLGAHLSITDILLDYLIFWIIFYFYLFHFQLKF